jgi:3-hydroxyisobutyrate dehydrogenase
MTKIAFIGLGKMGRPMAANLLKAGHDVIGFDVVSEAMAKHRESGGRTAESAATAAKEAEVIISMLPAGEDVRALYLGPHGLIAALGERRALIIDSSTIDVETARLVAAAAEKAGHEMLDAPVSGGVGGATAGTLTFMVGGSEAGFERAKPLLAAMGSNIVHTGGAGTGQAAKICNNMILGVSMLAVCEAFVLADKLGLAREKLFAVASKSSGQCWSLTSYCPVPGPVPSAPSNRDYEPGFTAALMLKDLRLSQLAAAQSDAPTPLGAHAAMLYQRLAESGLAEKDFSVAFRWLSGQSRSGLVPEQA